MIPKIIHYCWFGGKELSPLAKKCIKSWKKYCPDYDIIQWNESNYDVNKNSYMAQAYECKKWGFVPDYARLDIIYNNGGIYLDTDVEIVRSLDGLLDNKLFVGMETSNTVALGLGFGAEKHTPFIKEMMKQYDELSFLNEDGMMNLTPSPRYQTLFFEQKEYHIDGETIKDENCTIYAKDFFNPMDMQSGLIELSENTYSIHHYAASWETTRNKIRGKVYNYLYRICGEKIAKDCRKIFGKKK